jgi:hypothetical protein
MIDNIGIRTRFAKWIGGTINSVARNERPIGQILDHRPVRKGEESINVGRLAGCSKHAKANKIVDGVSMMYGA